MKPSVLGRAASLAALEKERCPSWAWLLASVEASCWLPPCDPMSSGALTGPAHVIGLAEAPFGRWTCPSPGIPSWVPACDPPVPADLRGLAHPSVPAEAPFGRWPCPSPEIPSWVPACDPTVPVDLKGLVVGLCLFRRALFHRRLAIRLTLPRRPLPVWLSAGHRLALARRPLRATLRTFTGRLVAHLVLRP